MTDVIKELKDAVFTLELADARLDRELCDLAIERIKTAISFKGETLSFADDNQEIGTRTITGDPINPSHYKDDGLECIEIAEVYPYNIGNAIKYAWRAGLKDDLIQDLKKCLWYVERAISQCDDIHTMFYNGKDQRQHIAYYKCHDYVANCKHQYEQRKDLLNFITFSDLSHAKELLLELIGNE